MDASVREGKVYEFGRFRLDPTRRTLTANSAPVELSPTVFDTLLYLVENPGRVVTKAELMNAVWSRKVVADSNITQTIFTLRKALAATGEAESYVATHPGQGYRFAAPVVVQTAHGKDAAAPGPGPGSRRRVRLLAGVAVAILIGVGAWAGAQLWVHRAPPARRLVVLGDFANLTGEPLIERTFAEATRSELLQSPYLSVLSDTRMKDTLALMTRPPDAPTTATVLQEVCARNNGLAVVHGALGRVGARYLVTLGADDCANGEPIAAERAEATGRDDLLPALDRLTRALRGKLGESAASVTDFSVPLVKARTASFEALKAYSEARFDVEHGKRTDAIPLYRYAITLDPTFAAAHAELAVVFYNLKQTPDAVAEITAARRSMNGVDPRERLAIANAYNAIVDRDAEAGLQIFRTSSQVFPNDAEAWANLANQETWLGEPQAAIEPARRALALEPGVEAASVVLARAYLHADRFADARRTVREAESRKIDGDDLHGVAYQIAIATGDAAAAAREMAWASGKAGERWMLIEAGQAAFRSGQVRRGLSLFARAVDLGRRFGIGDFTAAPNARLLYEMGLADQARASLAAVPAGFDSADYRFSLAEFGDASAATRLLDSDLARAPRDTLLNRVFAPEVRAALALRSGRPSEAIQALAPATPYELRNFDIPYLRGVAWLAAGDGASAAAEFHKVLDHPGVEAVSVLYPLSHLGLARAEAMRGDRAAAGAAYRAFLADWKDADPDMPLLAKARAEYARLTARS
jgi:DNA-binding winged helix-turn-helix (wHTH) protein/tetratricopeptide (TPR) repeat protein